MGIKMRDGTGAQTGLGALTHLCLMRASWEPADLFHSPDVTVLTVTFFFNAWLQSIFKEKQRPDEERLLLLLGIGLDLYSRDFTESRETRVSNLGYERAHFSEVKKQFKSCK